MARTVMLIGGEAQPERNPGNAGPVGQKRHVESGTVPGDEHTWFERRNGFVEFAKDVGFGAIEDRCPAVAAESNRNDWRLDWIEPAARGVGLDVEAINATGGDVVDGKGSNKVVDTFNLLAPPDSYPSAGAVI